MKEKLEVLLKNWKEEFAFCGELEKINVKNKEYLIAHNHCVRKKQILCCIKELEEILK